MMENLQADIVIVGAGIAGLSTALYLSRACPVKKILIMDKSDGLNSNTIFAQGGIAAVSDTAVDSFEYHVKDTLEAGRYANEPEIVQRVIAAAPEVVEDLVSWGVEFDRDTLMKFELGLEGGHSFPRIVHHKDHTGAQVHQVLRNKIKEYPAIGFLQFHFAIDVWIDRGVCKGIVVFNPETNEVFHLPAQFLILATGGSGQVFEATSNPPSATGDGLAMAIRAGAEVEGLQFYQFHPTSLFSSGSGKNFLITEALRGAGAIVVNHKGERFLLDYDPKGELAPRDKVTAWIFEEMYQTQKEHVYLDARHLGEEKLKNQFPTVYNSCLKAGFDLVKMPIPIVPAAHYQCGGIKVDHYGKTSVPNLFAVGECSHTGLHGANRLASNSLPEAMVFAKNTAGYINETKVVDKVRSSVHLLQSYKQEPMTLDLEELNRKKLAIKSFMSEAFTKKLPNESVSLQIHLLEKDTEWVESKFSGGYFNELMMNYRNLLIVAKAMLKARYSI